MLKYDEDGDLVLSKNQRDELDAYAEVITAAIKLSEANLTRYDNNDYYARIRLAEARDWWETCKKYKDE